MNNGRDYWDASAAMSIAAQSRHNAAAIAAPYDVHLCDLTLFVSCCNEESSIEATLDTVIDAMKVIGKSYEIIIIDDASKDHSVERVRRYIDAHPDLVMVLRANKENKGLAQNYIDAAFIGSGQYYRLVCGNNAEPMEMMADVFGALGEADIIAPYYIPSLQRHAQQSFFSLTYSWLLNLISGNRINDYNGRHVHLRFNVLRWHPNTRGAGFQAGLLCQLLALGFTCKQVPCRNARRQADRLGRLTFSDMLSILHIIAEIGLRRIAELF